MELFIYVALAAVGVALACLVGIKRIRTYRNYRGKMLVACPENGQTVGVSVDAKHAALSGAAQKPDLRLRECTRWPEHQNCGQECLNQIRTAPADCMVRTMLADWYRSKTCAFCGREFQNVGSYDDRHTFWYDQSPALLSAEGKLKKWHEVPVEELPEVLATHKPVCWDCQLAAELQAEHPELVAHQPTESTH